jgi:prepilin-type processing-associated H-X9-DG protein
MNSTQQTAAFSRMDLLFVAGMLSILMAVLSAGLDHRRSQNQLALCSNNLSQIARAVLVYANDHDNALPGPDRAAAGDFWWWYKEQVKSYTGLTGPSSPTDMVFSCPVDRGYTEAQPFCKTARFDYTSYVFNGVLLPGMPNIAGWKLSSLASPKATLLVMEWPAHAPLSWHRSRTGKANAPFYSDAEANVAFADGRVALTKIYYDGYNAAFTRDPITGYDYRYSGR